MLYVSFLSFAFVKNVFLKLLHKFATYIKRSGYTDEISCCNNVKYNNYKKNKNNLV